MNVFARPVSSQIRSLPVATSVLSRQISFSYPVRMPSSNPDAVNAAGLKPAESKSLSERSAEPHEERIVQSIKELYTCQPKAVCLPPLLKFLRLMHGQSTYEIYTSDAVFHDPVGIAQGVDSIRAQFDALPKVCQSCSQKNSIQRQ